jgi:hypothetical protein
MMKRVWGFAVATALAATALPAAPALADSGSNYAKSSCSDRVRRDYSASTHNVSISERGYDRYNVTGEARRNGEAANFTCRTDRGSVQSLSVGNWRRGSSNNTGNAVAAVGLAVGLAAIIAAASSKKKQNEQYDRYGRQDYDRNNNGYSENDSYSAGSGVTCYRAQRACFDNYDNYNPRWTQREFSY